MNSTIIIIISVCVVFYTITCRSTTSTPTIYGTFIDPATGKTHILSQGMANIDGELYDWDEVATQYTLQPLSYKGSQLMEADEYNRLYIEKIIKNLAGAYMVAENANLFITVKDDRVTGFLWYETGEEYALEGVVAIKNIYLIRIQGIATMVTDTQTNVEYDVDPGSAFFQIEATADDIIFTSNHNGYLQSYNCRR